MTSDQKLVEINSYFTENPAQKPFYINRILDDLNDKELDTLYRAVLMAKEGIISSRIPEMTDRDHQVFFTAIQWTGSAIGQEVLSDL